jgi:Na+-translocating ferredoxin:NAD+ oxidoreductase RNF subunit RnfB
VSLLGAKCARCGERTRGSLDGHPMCAPCREQTQLMLVAQSETTRRCPVDGAELTKEIAHMLVIDRCPACRGIWLDADEMERINQEVANEAMMAVVRGSTPGF